jgi:hypothetical protein
MARDGGRVPDVSEQRAGREGLEAARLKLPAAWRHDGTVDEGEALTRVMVAAYLSHADPASVLAVLLAERPEATAAAIEALGFDRARDGTVAVEDVQSLVNALRRIAYGLEGEMGWYDTPRGDTWWGRIALEALAQFGPARAGESDEGGNQ